MKWVIASGCRLALRSQAAAPSKHERYCRPVLWWRLTWKTYTHPYFSSFLWLQGVSRLTAASATTEKAPSLGLIPSLYASMRVDGNYAAESNMICRRFRRPASFNSKSNPGYSPGYYPCRTLLRGSAALKRPIYASRRMIISTVRTSSLTMIELLL